MPNKFFTIFLVVSIVTFLNYVINPFYIVRAVENPNVVLVVLDDVDENILNQMLNLNLLPNIKSEIVDKSVRFTNSFVTYSQCCPSRASILTGKYPHNTNVKSITARLEIQRYNEIFGAWTGFRKYIEDKTIAKWLKDSKNYTNGFVGKFVHGYGRDNPNPEDNLRSDEQAKIFNAGWDFFKAVVVPDYNYLPTKFRTIQLEKGAGNGGPWTFYPERTELAFLTTQTDHFINKHGGVNPFFLYVAPLSPHSTGYFTEGVENARTVWTQRVVSPQCITGGYQSSDFANNNCPNNSLRDSQGRAKDSKYLPLSLNSPSFGIYEQNAPWNVATIWPQLSKDYSNPNYRGLERLHLDRMEAMLSVDVMIKKLFDVLEAKNILQNTAVIFVSDNGYVMGEHNLGNKISAYEESIRVPLFIRYDSLTKNKSAISENIALNIDITPTILSLVGVDWTKSNYAIDGRSLTDAISTNNNWRKSFIVENWKFTNNYWEFPDYISFRDNSIKFVEYFKDIDNPQYKNSPIYGQYFDLINDKYEMQNYYSNFKKDTIRYNQLKSLVNNLYSCSGASCRNWDRFSTIPEPKILPVEGFYLKSTSAFAFTNSFSNSQNYYCVEKFDQTNCNSANATTLFSNPVSINKNMRVVSVSKANGFIDSLPEIAIYRLIGDINTDDLYTIPNDLIPIAVKLLKGAKSTDTDFKILDMNKDNLLNLKDIIYFLKVM